MKRTIFKTLLLALISTAFFSACTKTATTPASDDSNNINSTVVTGNFTITKFTDSNPNEDKTSDFSGYVFTFHDNGELTAVKDGITTTGTYTEKPAHEGEAAKLIISFNNDTFDDISKSWQADVINDNAIHLSDDDNAAEVLEFSAE